MTKNGELLPSEPELPARLDAPKVDPAVIDERAAQIDFASSASLLTYGLDCQAQFGTLSNELLGHVNSQDIDDVGVLLADMVSQLQSVDVDTLDAAKQNFLFRMFFDAKKQLEKFEIKIENVDETIQRMIKMLDRHKTKLIWNVTLLDQLYTKVKEYYVELDTVINVGHAVLARAHSELIPPLQAQADQGDALAAQQLRDKQDDLLHFERRLFDLSVTRTAVLQVFPKISLQKSAKVGLIHKINTSVMTTVPLWHTNMMLAVTGRDLASAALAEDIVIGATSKMLEESAERTRQSVTKAREVTEKPVIAIESLRRAHETTLTAIDETIDSVTTGRAKRAEYMAEIRSMEAEFRAKLLTSADKLKGDVTLGPPSK